MNNSNMRNESSEIKYREHTRLLRLTNNQRRSQEVLVTQLPRCFVGVTAETRTEV